MAVRKSTLDEWVFGDGSHGDWKLQVLRGRKNMVLLFGDDGISITQQEAREMIGVLEEALEVLAPSETQAVAV